ncbi:MAG: hypothetical protein ACRDX8_09825 [Acidimicrobiales bacterium]
MAAEAVSLHQLDLALQLVEGAGGVTHRLGGREVLDGECLELLTDSGWIGGHYRPRLQPETGGVCSEMHIHVAGSDALAHVAAYLPPEAIVRWPRVTTMI